MVKTYQRPNGILKTLVFCSGLAMSLLLTSCYSTTVSVGDMKPTDPSVECNKAHNGHFIGGLVNATKVEDDVYVGNNKNYLMKTYNSVGDVVVSVISAGLFSPSTTKFYIPYGEEMPPRVKMPPVRFGIRGGLTFASHTGDVKDESGYGSKMGYKLGAILDVPMTPQVYFQPGLYYSIKKTKYTEFNYIEVPFLLSYRIGVNNLLKQVSSASKFNKPIQAQINLGPYVAVAYDMESKEGAHLNRPDFGIQAGLGVLIEDHIYVGASYDFGLYNVVEAWESWSKFEDSQMRNLSISIGYNF